PDGSGTVTQAAADLGVSASQVETDPATNILGAAAVLADNSKATNNGVKPTSSDVNDWYGAVAKYVGVQYYQPAKAFANNVFGVVQHGASGVASDGESLTIHGQSVQPNTSQIDVLNLSHLTNSPSDYPGGYWTPAGGKHYSADNRPKKDLFIQYIVIHDTEEDYPGTVRAFTNPGGCCSSHYIVDGATADAGIYPSVTQMVHNKDIAYHAGNWWFNQHSIGIEDVGFADTGADYTQAMYDANARLVAYLAAVYNIPINRSHILEHGTVPAPFQGLTNYMHWDPGTHWDWPYWESRVVYYYENVWTNNAPLPAGSDAPTITTTNSTIHKVVPNNGDNTAGTISAWQSSKDVEFTNVYADDSGKPSSQLIRGASDPSTWVSPSNYNAADFSCDKLPDATQNADGTWTEDTNSDTRAKVDYGEEVSVLGTYTDTTTTPATVWDKIDFNGVTGWILDSETTTSGATGAVVTFTGAGGDSMYGKPALSSAAAICPESAGNTSRAGESYVAQTTYTDANGVLWYEIFYNHRAAWVPASEVTVS
ncbi:MAG TPA: peptidoglycan recognition family protein, partial [Ktedonobacterales bacterium]